MGIRNKGYVDTSALIAFLDHSDTHYQLFLRLFSAPPNLITSSLVVSEGHAWFLRRYDRTRALEFMHFIKECKALSVLPIGSKEIFLAKTHIEKFKDQNLTLVDATGLLLMQQHKVRICWSTDRHLGLTGVPLVIHQNE